MHRRRNGSPTVTVWGLIGAALLFPASIRGDALVVTKAMQASTIAEVQIEADRLRVDLEIGAADVMAFANIFPDELARKLSQDPLPLAQRRETFFTDDWVIEADGRVLQGTPRRITVDKRVVRDEVTGDPLPNQPEDADVVIRLRMDYALEERPQVLTLRPPMKAGRPQASVGFVCYHQGIPVNDFRYLAQEVTLDLDWDDPWYSQFRHPNLRRQFHAPMSAYLYVESYEVRQEVIVRPIDLLPFLDLPLPEGGLLPVAQQSTVKEQVADFLAARNPVVIDGRSVQGTVERVHFIRRSLRSSGIIEPPEDLDVHAAELGLILVYPVPALPQEVSLTWELFTPKIQVVPTVAADEAGGVPGQVTPDQPLLVWKNFLTQPTDHALLSVPRPPSARPLTVPLVSTCCLLIALGVSVQGVRAWRHGRTFSRKAVGLLVGALLLAGLCRPVARLSLANPLSRAPALSQAECETLVTGLLYNTYRAFDHHDESVIYDRLSQSVAGDLLSEVYLETRKSMEVKNQGGLRISVKDVEVTGLTREHHDATEMHFRCAWRVAGWIGHWGHIHRRENQHVAQITIAPQEGHWKIVALELLQEAPGTDPARPPVTEDAGA